jgi:NAD+--asparagine ADP-ribosyltransferase
MSIFENVPKLTKEQFEAGHPFLIIGQMNPKKLRFRKAKIEENFNCLEHYNYQSESWEWECLVKKFDNDGFVWSTQYLGVSIREKTPFEKCLPFKEEGGQQ